MGGPPERRGRIVRLCVLAVACTVLAGALLTWVLAGSSSSGAAGDTPTAAPAPATVTVSRTDLVVEEATEATLVFTLGTDILSPADGTLTGIVAPGDTVVPGTVVASVDSLPVVALVGDVPAWRELSTDSDDGVDIRQLEMNLVDLGFDPDGAIDIDEHFDDATADAVVAWEDALGMDPDGVVDDSQIVFVGGDVAVDDTAVGSGAAVRAGDVLASGRIVERRFDVAALREEGGIVDSLAPVGSAVDTGTVLFTQAGWPVVASVGDVAALPVLARDLSLGVGSGADVEMLERVLAAGGFDASGALVVDDEFDQATADAVLAWIASLGVPSDVTEADDVVVPAGTIVTVPAGLSVVATAMTAGEDVASDRPVMTLGAVTRLVEATVSVGDSDFELGASVDVEFPDGTVLDGAVVDVDTVLTTEPNGDTGAVAEIGVAVDGVVPALFEQFVEVPLDILVPGESALQTLAVPVSALVALAEGGYAVEVVVDAGGETATTRLVAVETGLFADGLVAVDSDGLAEGDEVVVPS